MKSLDIIKTIEDDEEVENFSEDSDVEISVCRNYLISSIHIIKIQM